MLILKRFYIYLVICLFAFILIPNQTQAENGSLSENGIIVDGRILVPLCAIFKELGVSVNWDQNSKIITAVKDHRKIKLQIGSRKVTVNDKTVTIDVPAQVQNGKTYVPLRFVSESLGAKVEWNSTDQSALISTSNTNIVVKAFPKNELFITIDDKNNLFVVNGISLGISEQEVKNILGNPKGKELDMHNGSYMDVYYVQSNKPSQLLKLYVNYFNNNDRVKHVKDISFELNKNVSNEKWYKNLGKPFAVEDHAAYFYLEGTEQVLIFKSDGEHDYGFLTYADNNFYYGFDMYEKMQW